MTTHVPSEAEVEELVGLLLVAGTRSLPLPDIARRLLERYEKRSEGQRCDGHGQLFVFREPGESRNSFECPGCPRCQPREAEPMTLSQQDDTTFHKPEPTREATNISVPGLDWPKTLADTTEPTREVGQCEHDWVQSSDRDGVGGKWCVKCNNFDATPTREPAGGQTGIGLSDLFGVLCEIRELIRGARAWGGDRG